MDALNRLIEPEHFPLSFCYDGVTHTGLQGFKLLDSRQDGYTLIRRYAHASHTVWTVRTTAQQRHSALQWQVDVTALEDTGVFSEVCYDFLLTSEFFMPMEHLVLHGNLGDENGGYVPFAVDLAQQAHLDRCLNGRPTHNKFPYYTLIFDGGSINVVLSWQGKWFTRFSGEGGDVRITAGQDGLRTRLYKGETLRLPMMVVQNGKHDPVNAWRGFYMDCIMPKMDGAPVPPMVAAGNGRCDSLSEDMLYKVKQWYDDHQVPYDFWWCDAGWASDGISKGHKYKWWYHGASLDINQETFPDQLAGFGKQLAAQGKDFMIWFEFELLRTPPEAMDEFYTYHPDFKKQWLLGTFQKDWCGVHLVARLYDLGNPDCLTWLEEHLFGVMDTAGANVFRIDFNIDPGEIWDSCNTPDREGIVENKYCQGYLQLLQDVKRHGVRFMDSCASGGGRNDLETLQYMLPLHYSDHQDIAPMDSNGFIYMQEILYRWFPCIKNFVTIEKIQDPYAMYAAMNPFVTWWITADEHSVVPETADAEVLKAFWKQWDSVRDFWYADYYLLEPVSNNDTDIKAHEFFSPERDAGFAMVFCPHNCKEIDYTLRLQGLNAGTEYQAEIDGHTLSVADDVINIPVKAGQVSMVLFRRGAYIG